MGTPDYKRWLRQKKRTKAIEGTSDDADIRADDAHESRHRYRYFDREDGRWREEVPMRHWTAGSWAQLLLIAFYWALFGYLLYFTGAAPRDGGLKTILWLASLLPAIIAGAVTWHTMGRENRDRLRLAVRVLPLALIAFLVFAGQHQGRKKERSSGQASQTAGRSSAPTTAVRAPPTPAPRMTLTEAALEPGLEQLEGWWRHRSDCLRHLQSATMVPSSGSWTLREAFSCVRETERARPELEVFAARHEDALLDAARAETPPRVGLVLALGHLPESPEPGQILLRWANDPHRATEPALLEALTVRGMRWPAELAAPLRALPADAPDSASLLFATVAARTQPDRTAACDKLAGLALREEDHQLSAMAQLRLRELAPFCSSIAPSLFDALTAFADMPESGDQSAAFRASAQARLIEHTSLREWLPARVVLEELRGRPGTALALSELSRASDALLERAFQRAVGLSPLVFGHDQTRELLPKDAVEVGPCSAEDLGLRARAHVKLSAPPECVVANRVPDWIRAPLEPWRARLDGWDMTAYRALRVPTP